MIGPHMMLNSIDQRFLITSGRLLITDYYYNCKDNSIIKLSTFLQCFRRCGICDVTKGIDTSPRSVTALSDVGSAPREWPLVNKPKVQQRITFTANRMLNIMVYQTSQRITLHPVHDLIHARLGTRNISPLNDSLEKKSNLKSVY